MIHPCFTKKTTVIGLFCLCAAIFLAQPAQNAIAKSPKDYLKSNNGNASKNASSNRLDGGPVSVVAVQFGTWEPRIGFFNEPFTEKASLWPVRDRTFAWRAVLQTTNRELTWTEEVIFPSTPKKMDYDKKTTAVIAVGDTVMTRTTKRVALTDSSYKYGPLKMESLPWKDMKDIQYAGNSWTFASGDPVGTYRMRIFIGDTLIKDGTFEVTR